MNCELKDRLKPPFVLTYYPHDYLIIDSNKKEVCRHFDYEVGQLIADALNEKCERDFGELMRWKYRPTRISPAHNFHCPKCGAVKIRATNYCPDCGKRLDLPEEARLCQKCPDKDCPHKDNKTSCWEYDEIVLEQETSKAREEIEYQFGVVTAKKEA